MATTPKAWFKINDTQSSEQKRSLWIKDAKLLPKCSDILNSVSTLVVPSYFSKRTKTFKRLVKRYYYLSSNMLFYAEKQKSQQIKGQLDLNNVYAEFYESKVAILKNTTYIIRLLQDNNCFVELLTDNQTTFQQWNREIRKHCFLTDFSNQFSIIKMIGKGGFARVFLAEDHQTRDQFAVKVISKDSLLLQPKGIKSLQTEIQVMRELKDVPGCLKLYGVYVTDSSVNLILEYIRGGELVKRLRLKQKQAAYTMENVWQLIREILEALARIHAKHIIHRDLKPENILLLSNSEKTSIKIADYGLSTFDYTKVQSYIFKRCGTPGFIAPEVLSSKNKDTFYDQKVDIFSAGVIFYILLCGEQPFVGTTLKQVLELNKQCRVNFDPIESNPKIPLKAKQLVRIMLEKNPTIRPTAAECLNSIFINENDQDGNLSIEFIKYDANRLMSIDGQNKIPLSFSKEPTGKSEDDLYWTNPLWKGQTKTIHTESKLSSTYIQLNEVRKRNKSNFAPNSPQLLIQQDESAQNSSNSSNNNNNNINNNNNVTNANGSQIREIRSASADSDLKMKFQSNQSLHIAVLKKQKQGDEAQSQQPIISQQQQKKTLYTSRDKASTAWTQERMTTNYTSNERTASITNYPASLHRWEFQTEPKQSSIIMEESNLEKYNTLDEVRDISNEDNLGLARRSGSHSEDDPNSDKRTKSKSLPNYMLTNLQSEDFISKQECNLNANEADENHCQTIQLMQIELKKCFYLQNKVPNPPDKQSNPSFISHINTRKRDPIGGKIASLLGEIDECEIGMNQMSSQTNSSIEADFKYSEVEEHQISLDHLKNQINRNILCKFNPFNKAAPATNLEKPMQF